MKNAIALLLLQALVSCNTAGGGEENTEEVVSDTVNVETETNTEPEVVPQAFTVMDASEFDLSQLSYTGEMKMKKFWLDAKGENIVLFTGQEDLDKGEATLFVYHYLINEGKAELLKEITGSVTDCADADLFLDFNEEALSVSDLDENNIGEITFAYRKACVTDVSPHDLVLHLLEDGNEYSLVGYNEVQIGPQDRIGGNVIEKNFDGASPSFFAHANEVWEKIKGY